MMTKEKSKQIKQLKYLMLIPVLASMLIYTSCNENEAEVLVQQKQKQTFYSQKDILKNETRGKETFLDMYLGVKEPDWKEITYNNLTQNEKEELGEKYEELKSNSSFTVKLYELENKRRVIATIINMDKIKKESQKSEYLDGASVPFAVIEEVPVYPGCVGTRKQKSDCLSAKISKHMAKNFNVDLAKNLGLSKGKKKIWIQFKN